MTGKPRRCPNCGYKYIQADRDGAGVRVLVRAILVKSRGGQIEVTGKCPNCKAPVMVPDNVFGRVRYVMRAG